MNVVGMHSRSRSGAWHGHEAAAMDGPCVFRHEWAVGGPCGRRVRAGRTAQPSSAAHMFVYTYRAAQLGGTLDVDTLELLLVPLEVLDHQILARELVVVGEVVEHLRRVGRVRVYMVRQGSGWLSTQAQHLR